MERLQYRGKLAEAKQEKARIEALALPYITKIRMALDPTADRLTELDLADLPEQAGQLYEYWTRSQELDLKITRLKETLGE